MNHVCLYETTLVYKSEFEMDAKKQKNVPINPAINPTTINRFSSIAPVSNMYNKFRKEYQNGRSAIDRVV